MEKEKVDRKVERQYLRTGFASSSRIFVVVVALLFYVNGKHLRSCRDGQLTNHTFPGQA